MKTKFIIFLLFTISSISGQILNRDTTKGVLIDNEPTGSEDFFIPNEIGQGRIEIIQFRNGEIQRKDTLVVGTVDSIFSSSGWAFSGDTIILGLSEDDNQLLSLGIDNKPFFDETIIDEKQKEGNIEIWLKIGQSNAVGIDFDSPIDYDSLDRPHPKVFEFSRGLSKGEFYHAAPYGELMLLRNPCQDDNDGISFAQSFGKRRVELNPDIDKLIIINRAVSATSFKGRDWNRGDDLYDLAMQDLKFALRKNPTAVFKGVLWHQGESDLNFGQQRYQDSLSAMVQGIRDTAMIYAPSRSKNSVFVCGTMVQSFLDLWTRQLGPIDAAHRNIANYIENANFCDFSNLTDLFSNHAHHFGQISMREMGRIYADTIQKLNIQEDHRQNYNLTAKANKIIDLYERGNVTGTVVHDEERGQVIDISNGLITDFVLDTTEYTKAAWVKLNSIPVGFGHLLSGQLTALQNQGHYWGWNGVGHGILSNSNEPLSNHLVLNEWVHVAVVYNGNFSTYINGQLVAANESANNQILNNPQVVEIGSFQRISTQGLKAFVDNVIIMPIALPAHAIIDLYNQ